MRLDRGLPTRLSQIAQLQALRTLASRGELARAQEQRDIACGALGQGEEALAGRAEEIERLFDRDTLDIAALDIGRAVLTILARERDALATELEASQAEEEQRRRSWNVDSNLEKRAREIHRKASRHAAHKREEAASLEVTFLRLVRAHGARR